MKHLLNFATVMLLGVTLVFSSCDKDDDPEPENNDVVSGTITINATAYDKWIYFSFANEKEVEVNDFSNSSDWDIGFHRQDIRVNCGKSGTGKGGTYNAGKVDFASFAEAPETGYLLNDSIEILEAFVMPPVKVKVPGDTLLAKWIDIKYGQAGPEYTVSNNIYVVKTADAKYAKIWLKDYFNDNSETGYITMKYTYQPDGSNKLK
ncbi:MAG: HmuY family protein [Bacteroidetes bacterium]|nr:HmuY family protein [Bacteroidota bacterium]